MALHLRPCSVRPPAGRRCRSNSQTLVRCATTLYKPDGQQPEKCCPSDSLVSTARMYYEEVWSRGRVLLLNDIMSEDHEQHDRVWQPSRVGSGRKAMKRGILAYRQAYPDLRFQVQHICASATSHVPLTPAISQDQVCDQAAASAEGHQQQQQQPHVSQPPPTIQRSNNHASSQTDPSLSTGHAHTSNQTTTSSSSSSSDDDTVPTPQQHQHDSMAPAASTTSPSPPDPSCGWALVHWHASGTNLGPIREQPPTGQPVAFSGMSCLVFDAQGKIRQSFVYRQAPEDEKTYFSGRMAAVPPPSGSS